MITKFIEATNEEKNWGKFMVARFTREEWSQTSVVNGGSVIAGRGWSPDHILVFDLQTGEGALFRQGGLAKADLSKHKIWVCPLFESFLTWLYKQDVSDLEKLPSLVNFSLEEAPFEMAGYRRSGQK